MAFILLYQFHAFAECSVDSSWTVLKKESVELTGNKKLIVKIASVPDERGTREVAMHLIIFNEHCQSILERAYLDDNANFYFTNLTFNGKKDLILHAITQDYGGSDCGYHHFLFKIDDDIITEITPATSEHLSQGGFYIGKLADGNRWGVVLWDSTMDGDRHYAPAHFDFWTFVWDGARLLEQKPFTTSEKYNAGEVLEKLNLPYAEPKRPDNWGTC
jgi:hypothetical protein